MALISFWERSRSEVESLDLKQVVGIAGDGKLVDGAPSSLEFRDYLRRVDADLLDRYATQCLDDAFDGSGLALQDVVNEVGTRLGFAMEPGRYRGAKTHVGNDGLWRSPDGHGLVIEIKTTDTYRVALDRIAAYRSQLVAAGTIQEHQSSILIIVGRNDTGDLEAQIRGSRHAWDMRLISVAALLDLMKLRQDVEDPNLVRRIHAILRPREFTRLDEIVELVFSTAAEVREDEGTEIPGDDEATGSPSPPRSKAAFRDACAARIRTHFRRHLVQRSHATYQSPDGLRVVCLVSKEHLTNERPGYWFVFLPHQRDFLASSTESLVALGCGSENRLLVIPFGIFEKWLEGMTETDNERSQLWHLIVTREGQNMTLHRRRGQSRIDVTEYLLGLDDLIP